MSGADEFPRTNGDESTIRLGPGSENIHRIANYRIVRKLAQGGMGIVYEAVQLNPCRPVAIKVIRGGSYVDEHAVKLFQREAQTLGRLKHPGIAAIYEAGRTDDGQHFFAMELVRGIPLGQYLQSRPLPPTGGRTEIRARLQLFLRICDAISYAHQRGVIHRDLKPSNIMILPSPGPTALGEPEIKILDFGLARLTDADVTVTTCATELGRIAGTLPYMSPEQARGNPDEIDVRSDVYSLGVLLYEMLTGRLPYNVDRVMLHEAVRVIQESPPRRPSTLRSALRGDIETVTLKALEKEPAQRYQSSAGLAEEIRRLLTDQPILARPHSAGYQLRKLVRRHKGAFAFLATVFVLLAMFGAVMSVMFDRQRRLRAEAVAEARKSEQINNLLQKMLISVDPEYARGPDVKVREILDDACRRIHMELSGQADVQAALQAAIGRAYQSLGMYGPAEENMTAALRTRRRLAAGGSSEVAASLYDLAWLYLDKTEDDKAEPMIRECLRMQERFLSPGSKEVADAQEILGFLSVHRGDYDGADSLFRVVLSTRRKVLGEEHVETATCYAGLADVRFYQNRLAEAESLHRKALAIHLRAYGENSIWTAKTLNNMGHTLKAEKKYAEADTVYRRALAVTRRIRGEDHPNTAVNLYNIGSLYLAEGRPGDAEPFLRESLAITRKRFGNEHLQTALNLDRVGVCLEDLGKAAEAEQIHRESLAIKRRVSGPDDASVAQSLDDLGLCLRYQGRSSEAEPFYREALRIRRQSLGEGHLEVAVSQQGLATALIDLGRTAEAESLLQRCLVIRRKLLGDAHWRVAFARSALGCCRTRQGRFAEAESLVVGGYRDLRANPSLPVRHRRDALNNIIRLYENWEQPQRAAPYRLELKQLESKL